MLLIWRFIFGGAVFSISMLWWSLGVTMGFVFVFADRLIFHLVSEPEKIMGIKMKQLFRQGKLVEGMAVALEERSNDKGLIMRSILFLAIYIVLAFWTMASVPGAWQRGFVLGIGIHLFFDFWWDFAMKKGVDNWFWQLPIRLSKTEEKVLVFFMSMVGILIMTKL